MAPSLLLTAFPVVGTLLSQIIYLSPLPGVRGALASNSIGELNTLPYAVMLLATIAWMGYGLYIRNGYIVVSNIFGAWLSLWYLLITTPLQHPHARRMNLRIVVGGIMMLTLKWTFLVFCRPPGTWTNILGVFATTLCVAMFASPLSTIYAVVTTRDSSSIYGPLTAAQVLNCTLWLLYGMALADVWLIAPNVMGTVLGLLQMLLLLMFPKPNKRESHTYSEVQQLAAHE